jgi:hypothetical protein
MQLMIDSLKHTAIGSLVLLVICTGCGGKGLKEIRGIVTYDGKPLKQGTITLLPPDGKGPTAAALISDGEYSVAVSLGPKQVKIEGFEVNGMKRYPGSMMMCEDRKQILPERYNLKTELTSDITSGVRTYDFTLQK